MGGGLTTVYLLYRLWNLMQCFNTIYNIYQPDQDDWYFHFFILSLCLEPLCSFFLVLHEMCDRDFDRMILRSL